MDCNKLKTYAPQARRDFIKAVTDRAAFYGLTEEIIEPVTEQGDVAIIAGTPFPRDVAVKRKKLEDRIKRDGFDQVMEAMAYTWFNRFVAIRYMEIHGYLDHGYRVLSNPDGSATPEVVEHAEHVDLAGLDRDKVIELKLAGTKESELYRMLLIAQCNALHKAMPFLFEPIDDETELLVPDNLLHSDSIIRKLVNGIPGEDWQKVEIIGWLYQFYIKEKKDQVIGKVVKTEDIPAATQLFTPNWIVKYMVQNSLGRYWMATYPDSPLKGQMKYYIEPAGQTPEVKAQLNEITPDNLNPEEVTLLDPACGSGHILVEAYDLLKAIYQERGYRPKDVPRLILEKNLYGLEIDDRAAQLAAFALLMKARADDRRFFERDVQARILSITETKGLDATEITEALNTPLCGNGAKEGISQTNVAHLIDLFEHGKTFGSLIQVPEKLAEKLPAMSQMVDDVIAHGGMFERASLKPLKPLLEYASVLSHKYDNIVMNPPYCGSRYMTPALAALARTDFKSGAGDLFAVFVLRTLALAKDGGSMGVVCPFVWMFIATYGKFRRHLISNGTFHSMVRLEYNAFEPACVPVSTWIYFPRKQPCETSFIDLTKFKGIEVQEPQTLVAIHNPDVPYRFHADCTEFLQIPTATFAYSVTCEFRQAFSSKEKLEDYVDFTGSQNVTGRNSKYVRLWWEVNRSEIGEGKRWVLYAKGGGNRKWWGLLEEIVDWSPRARSFYRENKTSNLLDKRFWYRPGITYSMLTSNQATFRLLPPGAVYDKGGPSFHPFSESMTEVLLGLCNSSFADQAFSVLNPTLNLQIQDVKSLPIKPVDVSRVQEVVRECILLSRQDWDASESSLDFQTTPLLCFPKDLAEQSRKKVADECDVRRRRMMELEEENNRLFIEAYGLQEELVPDVSDDHLTLYRPDREEDIKRLASYAIGCMMGRYSLDEPGLVYAYSGGEGFDPSQYQIFPSDSDGIIPVTDTPWFDDDAANRFVEFVSVAWPEEHLEENLSFIAESIGKKKSESARDAIRRYFSTGFYKQHLSMYKRRPIYWLFSSGKQRAFECLVYLHRYNEGTLSRMRTEYVIPLQGKIDARIEQLKDDITAATSTAHRKRLQKERDKLVKQQAELQAFDEKLRHYADQRISLDLDDGVKVNYGKFGDLLAEVKAVTGKKVGG